MPDPIGRRTLLHSAAFGAAGLAASLTGCAKDAQPQSNSARPAPPTSPSGAEPSGSAATSAGSTPDSAAKVLLVFFSRAGENYWNGGRRDLARGNTAILADLIRSRIPCDVYEIEAADPYPDSYDATVARNVAEEQSDARPEIADPLPDLAGYETILLGSPVWNVRAPMIMWTFTEGVDLTGKTVLPFVTYAVSGLGSVEDDYRDALAGATVRPGLAVRGETVPDSDAELDDWLREAGLLA